MSGTSIDDLLGGPAPEDRPVPSGRPGAELFKYFLMVAALTAVGLFALRVSSLSAPWWFVAAVAVAAVLVFRAVRTVRPPLPSRHAGRSMGEGAPADGLRQALRRWETRLDWCHGDTGAFNRKLRTALVEIVDERLRQRHGITRESDPARARQVLGEPLWTFLAEPVRRPPSPRELTNLIAWMERI
ncbi:hypothetical protein [Hamadaea tsunoensis]|uniref:hypothetical protein n=1 Tax=Hamadaea tsunoensis TaxID=53368 RepID=UPI000416D273|nr:hypothetical protein [Hamadaea tsunoensis]